MALCVTRLGRQQIETAWQKGKEMAMQRAAVVLVSVTVPVAAADPVDLFERGLRLREQVMLWANPGSRYVLVGLGRAAELTDGEPSLERWQQWLSAGLREGPVEPGLGPVLFGGFSFDQEKQPTALWQDFPRVSFVLPEFQFVLRDGDDQGWLTVNRFISPQDADETGLQWWEKASDWLESARTGQRGEQVSPEASPATGDWLTRLKQNGVDVWEDDPETWMHAVRQGAQEIRDGHLKKIVLARRLFLRVSRDWPTADVLRALRRQQGNNCYLFAIRRGAGCFLGATPERLVEVAQQEVRVAALAGSMARGRTPEEDERLGERLLADRKNRAEHAVVREMIREALAPYCEMLHIPEEPVLMKLRDIQHLYTPVRGRLKPGRQLLQLVQALHPTPAVGGYPREAAMARVRALEQMDRGWYAGAIGWMDSDGNGEFAVALRSALFQGREAVLFAGCGIMGDSDPQTEWEETRVKMTPMLSAIGSVIG